MTATSHAVAVPAARPLRLVSGGVAVVAAGVWLWIALWGLAAGALAGIWPGADAWLITSGSMSPAFEPGDLVVTSPPEPGTLYDFPTVITYEQDGRIVTHRIVEVVDGAYVTKGDANRSEDIRPVAPEQVRGVGRVVVGWVGLPIHWWHTGRPHLTVLSIASIMASVVIVRHGLPDHLGERAPEPRPEPPRRRRRRGGKHRKVEQTWMEANGTPLIWTAFLATAMSAVLVTASASFAADTAHGASVSAGVWGTEPEVVLEDRDLCDGTPVWVDGPLGGAFSCDTGQFTKDGKGPNGGAWTAFAAPVPAFDATATLESPAGNGDVDGFAVVDQDGFGYRVSIRHGNNPRFRIDVLVDGARVDGSDWLRLEVPVAQPYDIGLSFADGEVRATVGGQEVVFAHDGSHMLAGFDSAWFTGKDGLVVHSVRVTT